MHHNSPITRQPGGPLDAPLKKIASRLGATTDQVLLAWTKAKGAVVVTYVRVARHFFTGLITFCMLISTSSKKSRLQGYVAAGDIGTRADSIFVWL